VFTDGNGEVWSVGEELPHDAVAGVLVFSKRGVDRYCWGTPICWGDPDNLRVLFELSIPLEAAA